MTSVEDLLPIGQFAALTWLSPKALRLYQAQGLLEPASVDPSTGYRYHHPSQVPTASRIALLRRAGISLREIDAYLAAPSVDRVRSWQRELEVEADERRRLLDHIEHLTQHRKDELMEHTPTAATTSASLQRAIPVLASLDLEATQRFYADRLGFEPVTRYRFAVALRF